MNPEFWQARWQDKRTGFNQPEVNPLLTKYLTALNLPSGSRVFVPLCGKSIDMIWLASQGYDVVGVELVESAVQAFFTENDISPKVTEHTNSPNNKCYQGQILGQTIELWAADLFALTPENLGQIDAVYDRAALIALPAEMRLKYSEQVWHLSRNISVDVSGNAPQILLTLNYDQSERNGPPFSISSEQVQQYYGSHYKITELEGKPSILNAAPELAVTEHVWLLSE
ncbi:thiopurine S-methyltransferase [Psychrobacter sp. LV10R520-6]|uniref:thiopurine S-methyltransferase n=1 Tax=Psychrobacter sp. LV10R520-6 TaxID=1415574 RepID=UPI0024C7EA9D|nr:thiopurine S-methyltransferase [Psychrobacter sp. LV10R520-6]SNT70802.1 thiopurine S-methyltransferase [Psychrobacter sp. LV10R520-6]